MLSIRYLRSGRTNSAFFRIVLTESKKSPKSGFIKTLGWYNPHSKETSINKDEILNWLDKGAKASNSVAKLLSEKGIKHKRAKYVPDTPKAKKEKSEPKPKPAAPADKTEETSLKDQPQPEAEASDDTKAPESTEAKEPQPKQGNQPEDVKENSQEENK